ncbi:hypothetical protein [Rhizobium laguerreae]|uniref:hypothetical protein n=1 Tax=Rhizobium laguerreae TaxID=1076926 RepID=UPI001C92A769|nr:hypothetical protein [Rhizobium laguerreae]MBY3434799.1 hypothetical protein [Rhizobium laguerreae]MBY3448942.1 hypothetical protein [Rhizobium laguerreae]MBY3456716.1 hypothetical protein [Rhizobium laguerreae]
MNIFSHWARQAALKVFERDLPQIVSQSVERCLDERLPAIIEDVLAKKFKERPDQPLSEVGFNWALALALRSYWPEVSNKEAVRWLRDYIEVPHGHPDYCWSPSAAQTIASEYVNEVGEIA